MSRQNLFECFINDPLVVKMINLLMRDGKKSKGEKILRHIFLFLNDNYPGQALKIFYLAVFNTQTLVGIRAKLKGKKYRRVTTGKESVVPYFVSNQRSQTSAIRAIFIAGKSRSSDHPLWENLSQEFVYAAANSGETIRKRYSTQELIKLNKRSYKFYWRRKLPIDPDRLTTFNFLGPAPNRKNFLERRKTILKWKKFY
uniref:Ribosomal protein S7 n=1 Tax=Dictyopteris divaricata TaxID=156996 RepID=A0A4Y5T800_9PHAE|nr:ribosomal protein S7 [Dictyopteris divaricata]QDB64119.1 ribosomal protein S7 [Dictyopteris divaricata]